ncbi:transposase [Nannocystis sp.]|uniref:IS66 family transposase n=1 Tax=Nannocystis sp. TaxID=1962667 RepID=UPI0025F9542E|nr:transposase [Nannocystis sp.]
MFPSAGLLPSIASAAGEPALFGDFVGTTSPSDLSGPYIVGLGLMAFPTRPLAMPSRGAPRRSPGSRAKRFRREQSQPLLDKFFQWCDEQAIAALDGTPISQALGYARNQRVALGRFVEDGRLPLDNNISERNLRREVLGRKNWLFLGSDEGARVNTIFVSLLASCQLHGIDPWAYLRDLFCLLRMWPPDRILELAPAFWKQTIQQQDTQKRLAANVFRTVTLADHPSTM